MLEVVVVGSADQRDLPENSYPLLPDLSLGPSPFPKPPGFWVPGH